LVLPIEAIAATGRAPGNAHHVGWVFSL